MPRCVASPDLESGAGDRVWCDQGDMGECEQLCFTQGELTCGQNSITLIPDHVQEVRSSVTVTPGTHWLQMVTSARTLMSARLKMDNLESSANVSCFRITTEVVTKFAATDPGRSCVSAPPAIAAPSRV